MSSSLPLDPIDAECFESVKETHIGVRPSHADRASGAGFGSPLGAAIWIAVAWVVGMLVFEMTSLGEQRSRHWIVQPSVQAELLTVQSESINDRASTGRH